jgi:NAD(P)-dependent dehydrogenase (short-subunit alcohol dehydrogenase family)
MIQLVGRTVLVTGASRGIGAAIAELFELSGAQVVGVGRSLPAERSERRLNVRCDLTRAESVATMAREVEALFGPPDVLVQNAGSFLLKPFESTSPAEFAEQLGANLQGAFHVGRAFLPRMRARGGGRCITIGSIADHRAFAGNAAYSAAKFGLRGLHAVWREEYRGTGLLCTLLSPGPTDTDAWDPYDPDHRDDLPPRRAMLRPEDVADAVLWIATRPPHVDIDWVRLEPSPPATERRE